MSEVGLDEGGVQLTLLVYWQLNSQVLLFNSQLQRQRLNSKSLLDIFT